ncbi:MAG: hypothetical protein ABW046_09335 [Actinoplanes sp.]
MTAMTTRSSVSTDTRTAVWSVAVAQYAFTLLYAVCGYSALARVAELTGHWGIPATDVDSAWGWSLIVGTILQMAPMLAAVGLLASVLLFLLGSTRGNRALTHSLLGATAATLLTLVVSLTPTAQWLSTWLLD